MQKLKQISISLVLNKSEMHQNCIISDTKVQIAIPIMQNNNGWFESPLPKASSIFANQKLDAPRSPSPQSPYHSSFIFSSPIPPPSFFLPSTLLTKTPQHTLSPWSRNLLKSQPEFDQFSLPKLCKNENNFDEQIDGKLQYSQEHLMTPIRGKAEQEDTTGRKSSTGPENLIGLHDKIHQQLVKSKTAIQSRVKLEDLHEKSKKPRPREKGLRKLSERAYEIVLNLQNATYKEVASSLLEELTSECQLDQTGKDEQNIKRRVYDALNVLIALGVLKKEGRRIVAEKKIKEDKKQEEEIEGLRRRLSLKLASVKEKNKTLKQSEHKLQVIRNHLTRNQSYSPAPLSIIRFPFIGLSANIQTQNMIIEDSKIVVELDEIPRPFGDVDSLGWLGKSGKKQ